MISKDFPIHIQLWNKKDTSQARWSHNLRKLADKSLMSVTKNRSYSGEVSPFSSGLQRADDDYGKVQTHTFTV